VESSLAADSFETDLNLKTTVFRGNVQGRLSEAFDFFGTLNDPVF
jgi:hypothetical protein